MIMKYKGKEKNGKIKKTCGRKENVMIVMSRDSSTGRGRECKTKDKKRGKNVAKVYNA